MNVKLKLCHKCQKLKRLYKSHPATCWGCRDKNEIAPISKRNAKRIAEYSIVRIEYLTDNPICQAKVKCAGAMSDQIHHKAGRIGTRLTDKNLFLAVCSECHIWIEAFPSLAKQRGFSVDRL